MTKDAISFKSQTEETMQHVIELMNPLWKEKQGDLHSFLKQIQETEISGKGSEGLVEKFDQNAQQLSNLLAPQKRTYALLAVQNLVYQDSAGSELEAESLQKLAECLLFFSQLEDQDDVRHFYERFCHYVAVDPEKEESVSLDRVLLKPLAEMMIIIAMANKMGEEDVEYIFSNIRKEWEGPGKEVGPFLNDIFKEVEVRENIGQDLVARFKEVTETLEKMCDEKQKKKVVEIIQGLIDADNKISVQEKILYKIVRSTMVG